MAYGSSKPPGPKLQICMEDILPYRTTLSDGTPVVLKRLFYPGHLAAAIRRKEKICVPAGFDIRCVNHASSPFCTLESTIASAHQLLNYEILQGNSFPFEKPLTADEFNSYFLGYDCFCLRVDTDHPSFDRHMTRYPTAPSRVSMMEPKSATQRNTKDAKGNVSNMDVVPQERSVLHLMDPYLVGSFYVKPNYPGRSNHLCNGGFLVAPAYRGLGAGFTLGDRYRLLAQRLGYRGSVFNLVFLDNPASNRLWEKLGFTCVGTLPQAGRHPRKIGDPNSGEHFVAATVWYLDLTKPFISVKSAPSAATKAALTVNVPSSNL